MIEPKPSSLLRTSRKVAFGFLAMVFARAKDTAVLLAAWLTARSTRRGPNMGRRHADAERLLVRRVQQPFRSRN